MKKILIYILFVCSLVIQSIDAKAQVLDNSQQLFSDYQENNYQEKLFVHTDRDTYLTSEIIWFKIYSLNAYQNTVGFSKVVYVDVLDEKNNFMLQAKVSFENGIGSGSFYIPKTIKTGVFKLRAYTNWLKNFGVETFFEKKLNFININSQQPTLVAKPSTYDIQFFPEGGDLINGLTSRVAFKVTDKNGKGIDISGAIVSEQNDTLTHFNTLKFGMGSFTMKPTANHNYKAISKSLEKEILIKELPKAKSTGYVMGVEKVGNEVVVKLSTNLPVTSAFLFVHNNKQAAAKEQFQFVGGKAELKVNFSKLEDGVSSFTVFNNEGKPVCERLYFKRPTKKIELEAAADQNTYANRKKVSIDMSAKNETGVPVKANISIAVYKLDSLNILPQIDIVSYLWLSSALKGSIESATYYLQNDNPGTNEALDNLMLSQGWRHFNWNDALLGKKPILKFLPELNGHLISGTTINPKGELVANKGIYIGVPGKYSQFYAAKINETGSFLINTKNLYGNREIVLLPTKEEDSLLKFKVLSPFVRYS